jgi:hypothetical protein
MLRGLEELCRKHANLIMNARGLGTFCALDAANVQIRDSIVTKLRNLGLFGLNFSIYFFFVKKLALFYD